jgi:hypothetical protein
VTDRDPGMPDATKRSISHSFQFKEYPMKGLRAVRRFQRRSAATFAVAAVLLISTSAGNNGRHDAQGRHRRDDPLV